MQKNINAFSTNNALNIEQLTAGVYFLEVIENKKHRIFKFMKK